MALSFNKIQPVRFGDFEATPKTTTSARMRIQRLKFGTQEDTNEAREVMSGVFGTQADEVLAFMTDNMSTIDLQRLQAYLIGGDSMLDTFDNAIKEAMKPENLKKEAENARN